MKVTRVAYSADLNAGELEQLAEQARQLGVIRSKVWREYGSLNGAITILDRAADPDIGLHTRHTRVKQIIQERGRRRSRLPDQDSNTTGHCRCGERNSRNRSA
jgi:hypothetical protein